MIATERTQAADQYFAQFAALEKAFAAAPWLAERRKEALERFGDLGFPKPRDEDWKYTNVAPIAKTTFAAADGQAQVAAELLHLEELDGARLVFINGRFRPELSQTSMLPKGVVVRSLAEAIREKHPSVQRQLTRYAQFTGQPFVALNTALFQDGGFIELPDGVALEAPVSLVFLAAPNGQPSVSHPRTLIVAGRQSQAAFVEAYYGPRGGVYFTNPVTELIAADDAVIEHYKLEEESESAYHVSMLQVYQGRSSNVVTHSVALGGALVRNDVNVVLDAEGAEATLNGLYVATRQQHVDNHTSIDHAKPHCNSRELYKGILAGHAVGVFNGGIIVREDAQKTDAKQSNKNLLLSENATINTKPQLQIWADDVRCTHGATIGQVDEDAIFYLRSRGIDRKAARDLLTYAFTNDLLTRMRVEPVRRRLERELFEKLKEA